MSEVPGQNGRALPDLQQPVCAITGSPDLAPYCVTKCHEKPYLWRLAKRTGPREDEISPANVVAGRLTYRT
jgi:hypothetical protein